MRAYPFVPYTWVSASIPSLCGGPPADSAPPVARAAPADQDDPVGVHAVRAVPCPDGGADPLGYGVAQDESCGVDRVHSHVHERTAAGEPGIDEPALRAPAGMDTVAAGLDDLAELTGRDPVAHRDHVRLVPPTVGNHQRDAPATGSVDHR